MLKQWRSAWSVTKTRKAAKEEAEKIGSRKSKLYVASQASVFRSKMKKYYSVLHSFIGFMHLHLTSLILAVINHFLNHLPFLFAGAFPLVSFLFNSSFFCLPFLPFSVDLAKSEELQLLPPGKKNRRRYCSQLPSFTIFGPCCKNKHTRFWVTFTSS